MDIQNKSMIEEIGKVKLDLSKYPGEDLYCDGAVEDEILDIVKSVSPVEYGRIIEERQNWPILYHLSPLRENIVDWLPIRETDKVLEVGSGCGAITGALARKAADVTCVDLSKKRSMINAFRHSECENVRIHVGNFKDIEPELPADYDYICLIGVFEYGQAYIGGERPYEEFLERLLRHLGPEGRIVIAIENQYGLKYFAGCTEDHLGSYFSGIENYPEGKGVRTFSRGGLERIFRTCGVEDYSFYYPYPDYKFMTTLYSDRYLPGKSQLTDNIRNFDKERILLFDEKRAFDGIVEDGLFPVFSNSYMAVLGKGFPLEYVKFSNDRALEYQIRTVIMTGEDGKRCVRKYPLSVEAREHVREMALACKLLTERYQGGKLRINPCRLEEQGKELYAEYPFEKGKPLSELFDQCLERQDEEGCHRLFEEYMERIGFRPESEVSDFDMAFSNLLVDGDNWTLIDYEWTFGKKIETRELAFRAVYCYLIEDESRDRLNLDWVLERLGISTEEAEDFRSRELEFQHFVTGKRRSMGEILAQMVKGEILEPKRWLLEYWKKKELSRVQIYPDTGEGFREETSWFVKDSCRSEDMVEFQLHVSRDTRALRIDPARKSCACRLLELKWNGEDIPVDRRGILETNGRAMRNGGDCPGYIFVTEDPNIQLNLSTLEMREENTLSVRFQIAEIPLVMAEALADSLKKGFNDLRREQDWRGRKG